MSALKQFGNVIILFTLEYCPNECDSSSVSRFAQVKSSQFYSFHIAVFCNVKSQLLNHSCESNFTTYKGLIDIVHFNNCRDYNFYQVTLGGIKVIITLIIPVSAKTNCDLFEGDGMNGGYNSLEFLTFYCS